MAQGGFVDSAASASQNQGVVRFNGVRFPVVDSIGYQKLSRWTAQKVTFGDPTRESDEIISSKIWTSFLAGIGIDQIREGSDEGSCWFSTLWTRTPYQLTLNRLVESVAAIRYPLGDLGTTFYASDGTNVYPVGNDDLVVGTALTNALAGTPVYSATEFNGKQYIPLGTSGYAYHNGTTVTNSVAIDDVIQFVVWDDTSPKLMALTSTGLFYQSFDGTTWSLLITLNSSYIVRRMRRYMDKQENETINIVHLGGILTWDPISGVALPSRLSFPRHPDNGYGVEMWRPGEDLFVTAGIGVYRWNLSAAAPVGLDRNEGVPSQFRGTFVDLCAEHNALLGYVRGQQSVASATVEIEFDPGLGTDVAADMLDTEAYSMVVAYTGYGWHPIWTSTENDGVPNWSVVSCADDVYRHWWGYGVSTTDRCYTIEMPRAFTNPRMQLEVGEGHFEPYGYLDTGWFDANMREFDKLALQFEVGVEAASSDERIIVSYKTDFDTSWTSLGEITTTGTVKLPFGVTTTWNGNPFSEGIRFNRIRFLIEMYRGSDDSLSPMIDNFVLKFRRIPYDQRTFNLDIPLEFENDEFEGRSPLEIKQALDDLMLADELVHVQFNDLPESSFRASLSMLDGWDTTGETFGGFRRVTLVVIPLDGYNGEPVS